MSRRGGVVVLGGLCVLAAQLAVLNIVKEHDSGEPATAASLAAPETTTTPAGTAVEPVRDAKARVVAAAPEIAPDARAAVAVPPAAAVARSQEPAPPRVRKRAEHKRRDRSHRRHRAAAPSRVQAAPPVKAAPTPAEKPRNAFLSVFSEPAGATVALDGVLLGRTPVAARVLTAGDHLVAVSLPGYEPTTRSFSVASGDDKGIRLSLSKLAPAVPSVAESTSKAPSPAPAPAVRRPARTPSVAASTEGNAKQGARLVRSTCNDCHRSRGVRSVSSRRYTKAQWDRFFARGGHDRFERLGGRVTRAQLAGVKSFLKQNAADSHRNQGAGIR